MATRFALGATVNIDNKIAKNNSLRSRESAVSLELRRVLRGYLHSEWCSVVIIARIVKWSNLLARWGQHNSIKKAIMRGYLIPLSIYSAKECAS
jgi:hypothetical protein